jgi:hypothetical protein
VLGPVSRAVTSETIAFTARIMRNGSSPSTSLVAPAVPTDRSRASGEETARRGALAMIVRLPYRVTFDAAALVHPPSSAPASRALDTASRSEPS